jgi:site-specific DNA recombinase
MRYSPGDNCIVHCRVSSAKQAQEGESLDVQENICRGIVDSKGWRIVPEGRVWRESFSGRKELRPVFEEILAYIDSHPGEVKYYVFRAIDRFTRGGSFSYETMKRDLARRGVQMVDTYGIIQPSKNTLEDLGFEYDWSTFSPSEITELVMSTTAKTEVTNILTRMIGQEIRLTQQGYKIRQAQDGFKNAKVYIEGKKRTILVPDPDRAKFYVEMFNLRASGQFTDLEIVNRVNAMGFRSRMRNRWNSIHERIIGQTGNLRLTVKQFQVIIQKPIYAGFVCEKWTRHQPVKAPYEGLVSLETFNLANRGKVRIKAEGQGFRLVTEDDQKDATIRRNRHNPLFPYKNVILCPMCRRPFFGSSSRGRSGQRFPAYHCSRGHDYFRVSKATLEAAVETFIRSLRFRSDVLERLETALIARLRKQQGKIMANAAAMGKNVAELEIQKAHALRSYLSATSPVVKAGIEQEIEHLDAEIKGTRGQRNQLEITEQDIHQFVQDAKYVLEHPSELLLNPVNIRQQQLLFAAVFNGLPDYNEIRFGTPKLAWLFELSSPNRSDKSLLVGPTGFEPVTKRL